MHRITTSLVALVAFATPIIASGQEHQVRALETRLLSVEERLAALEKQLLGAEAKPALETSPIAEIELPQSEFSVPENQTYVIRDGDSLGGIARKFGVPRQALLEANNMSEGQPIYIGETLVIPAPPKTEESPAAPKPAETDGAFHIVQSGDTLTGLARQYNTSIQDIKRYNNLQSDVIATGQKLMVGKSGIAQSSEPTSQVSPETEVGKYKYENPLLKSDETYGHYIVQKGDNLYALARDFFTTLDELQRLNKLGNSTIIHTGDELVVPTSKYNAYHNNVAGN